jgi:beta-lactam-binding protein with PASTA domain
VLYKKLAKAHKLISRRHCRVGKVTRKHSAHANRGRVIRQSPKASRRKRKHGFKVNLTVGE